jgi:hypothetical protein
MKTKLSFVNFYFLWEVGEAEERKYLEASSWLSSEWSECGVEKRV